MEVSVVLADGQTSGRGAKAVSILVVRKVISLLAEGVRDGAAARAASDFSLHRETRKSLIHFEYRLSGFADSNRCGHPE